MRIILLFLITTLYADIIKIQIPTKKVTIPKLQDKTMQDFSFYGDINIKPFFISKYEITKKEYNKYLKAHSLKELKFYDEDEENEPITNIDFNTAQKVCKFLGGRLPTQKEWIFAASIKVAPSKCYEYLSKYSFTSYPITKKGMECMADEDEEFEAELVGSELNSVEDSYENINGTFGMYGNVWEFVDDKVSYFNNKYAVIKGGSYANFNEKLLFDVRIINFIPINDKRKNIGFRCVWDIK